MTGCAYDKDHMSALWIKNKRKWSSHLWSDFSVTKKADTTREAPTNCIRDTIEQIMDDFL